MEEQFEIINTEVEKQPSNSVLIPKDEIVPLSEVFMPSPEAAIDSTLEQVENALSEFDRVISEKGSIVFRTYHVMLLQGNDHLLIEDFERARLQINNASEPWGKCIAREQGQIEHPADTTWRFPTEDEALAIAKSLKSRLERLTYEDNRIAGISVSSTDGKRADEVLRLSDNALLEYGENLMAQRFALDIRVSLIPQDKSAILYLLRHDLYPKKLPQEMTNLLREAIILFKSGKIRLYRAKNETTQYRATLVGELSEDECAKLGVAPEKSNSPVMTWKECKEALLNADLVRANNTPLSESTLTNPDGGIWEAFPIRWPGYRAVSVPAGQYFGRDPRLDIQQGEVIGIDFGTKSTVVTWIDTNSQIHPVRVGAGSYDQPVREFDYENPTVMEFNDLSSFLAAYRQEPGRPHTKWADLTISHAASDKLKGLGKAKDQSKFSTAYFTSLKQWASGTGGNVHIRDYTSTKANGEMITLRPYLSLQDGDVDPIEYYAYYIGLYINSSYTRKIYMEYVLSFPVTYGVKVRERILKSFERGLKKSLPRRIVESPDLMEMFRVHPGVPEPAAYAACALWEFNFRPKEGERDYFGIFDFGGGTTDFDYGVWRRADKNQKTERRYNYVIEHFNAGGVPTLGGENLLAEMAYLLFWRNKDELQSKNVQFTRSPKGRLLEGYEPLVKDTREALTNTRTLIEKLRPLWESNVSQGETGTDSAKTEESLFKTGAIDIDLYDRDGESVQVTLKGDESELREYLQKELAIGVEEFFVGLEQTVEDEREKIGRISKFNIFLAGNASKSILLQEVFRKAIEKREDELKTSQEKSGNVVQDKYYELFYPLNTPDAEKYIEEHGGHPMDYHPTGKTGVAVGLLLCRKGGKILVKTGTAENDEIPFGFFVGDDNDGFLQPYIGKKSKYDEWVEYWPADENVFEFRYTTLPSAEEGAFPVSQAKLERQSFPEEKINEDAFIFLRPHTPNTLQYCIAKDITAAQKENYDYGPIEIILKKEGE